MWYRPPLSFRRLLCLDRFWHPSSTARTAYTATYPNAFLLSVLHRRLEIAYPTYSTLMVAITHIFYSNFLDMSLYICWRNP
jgi:hypothetical protein